MYDVLVAVNCSFCKLEIEGAFWGTEDARICADCASKCAEDLDRRRELHARERWFGERPDALLEELDRRLVGQEAAKRVIVAALREQHHHMGMSFPVPRSARILLVGARGSGRTTLGRAMCDLCPWPSAHVDVGRLAGAGVPGDTIERLLGSLVRHSGGDRAAAARSAIFLDGLERIALDRERFDAAPAQRELLRLLDGSDLVFFDRQSGAQTISTEQMLVVASLCMDRSELQADEAAIRRCLATGPLLDAVVARFDRVVAFDPLTPGQAERILWRLLEPAREVICRLGGTLEVSAGASRSIAAAAAADPDGAWVVDRLVHRLLGEALVATDPRRAWRIDDPAGGGSGIRHAGEAAP